MNSLEVTYPDVTFVYMTGHLDYWNRENTNAANDSIRSFCLDNGKVLFDFADIESYGPEGTGHKENGDDACDYYNGGGDSIGNWAVEYQNTHTEGTDWYECGSAHSEPLNANLKAYAAWWMFASLAGWNYTPPTSIDQEKPVLNYTLYPNPAADYTTFEIVGGLYENIQVDLLSASGAVIENNMTPTVTNDKYVFHISTTHLEPAVYYLLVTSPDISLQQKLLVIR